MENAYKILQIPENANLDEIKAAFRRLARLYHPDMNPGDAEAVERFRQLESAYEYLRERVNRKEEPEITIVERDANYYYRQGLRYAKNREYKKAIDSYNRALVEDDRSWEVYLKRAEAHYHNLEDRQVLEDCRRVIEINPNCDRAYYYLGLARQRSGYTQSAIESYDRAIELSKEPGYIYYQRGLALEELGDYTAAGRDFLRAIDHFKKTGDNYRCPAIEKAIKNLHKKQAKRQKKSIFKIFKYVPETAIELIKGLFISILDPINGLNSFYLKLGKTRAIGVGILGIITSVAILLQYTNVLIAIVPIVIIFLSGYLTRYILKLYGNIAADLFIAGTTILPLAFFILIIKTINIVGSLQYIAIFVINIYLAWILYNAYNQISNIPTKIALTLISNFFIILVYLLWF